MSVVSNQFDVIVTGRCCAARGKSVEFPLLLNILANCAALFNKRFGTFAAGDTAPLDRRPALVYNTAITQHGFQQEDGTLCTRISSLKTGAA